MEKNIISKLLEKISPAEQEKTDAKMLLAARIDDAMKAKGWRNIDLMKAMGKKNPSEVTRWLSGTHNFTTETLVELQQVLGIKLLQLENDKSEIVVRQYHFTMKAHYQPSNFPANYVNEMDNSLVYQKKVSLTN